MLKLILGPIGPRPMDTLRKTIHENEKLNQQADRIRTILIKYLSRLYEKHL